MANYILSTLLKWLFTRSFLPFLAISGLFIGCYYWPLCPSHLPLQSVIKNIISKTLRNCKDYLLFFWLQVRLKYRYEWHWIFKHKFKWTWNSAQQINLTKNYFKKKIKKKTKNENDFKKMKTKKKIFFV